jgi:Zn-dependent peptidase ImmA (M78 family)
MQLANLIPNQHVNFLEDKANEILKNHSISKPWEIDIEKIVQSYKNIKFFYMNYDSKTILKRNRAIILIDNKLSYKEKREQLAEEFSHVLLHLGNQINYCNSLYLDKQENQAKRMSAYLLCPLSMIKELSVDMDAYTMIDEMAEMFDVTNEFMKYRLSLIFGVDINYMAKIDNELYGYFSI